MYFEFTQVIERPNYDTHMQEKLTISKKVTTSREVLEAFADFLVACSWEEEQIESAMKAFLDKQKDK